MGTNADGKYLSYIPEADASVPLVLTEDRHHHTDANIEVLDFASKLDKPVAPYYRDHLEAMGLPMQVTAAQLQAAARRGRHQRQRRARRCLAPALAG